MSNNKLEILQTILNTADISDIDVADYDMAQPDGMDESGSGGAWDMARDIAYELLEPLFDIYEIPIRKLDAVQNQIQGLIYNLITEYKDEKETDDNE